MKSVQKYYSDNWQQACMKFMDFSRGLGDVKWCVAKNHDYDIPYVKIGNGTNKIVLYSGLNGLDAFYGCAAQNMFLEKFASHLSPQMCEQYTVVLMPVVNGWGMDNKMYDVLNTDNKLVDLSRNFLPNFNDLPQLNRHYKQMNDLFVSIPTKTKLGKVADAVSNVSQMNMQNSVDMGQYENPDWLFYGGNEPTVENKMLRHIYKTVAQDATSIKSIGLRTGAGLYDVFLRDIGQLRVAHNVAHPATIYYKNMCDWSDVKCNTNFEKNGTLSKALESEFGARNLSVYLADFLVSVCVQNFDVCKYKYLGDAKYEFKKYGEVSNDIKNKSLNLFCPADEAWRKYALDAAYKLFRDIVSNMARGEKQK